MGDDEQLPLLILDRDGVINRDSDDFIKSPDEFIPLEGSVEAIRDLCRAGFCIVVASNQSGVGRGLFTIDTLERIHAKLNAAVEAAGGKISRIFYCPHRPDEGCDCRKPRPGLFRQIATAFNVDLHGVPAIGDSARDLEAAIAVGARPVLVRTGNGRATEQAMTADDSVVVYDDLQAAAAAIIAERRERPA